MKVKNRDIFLANKPLSELMNEKLPVNVSYDLVKLYKKINSEYEIIEQVRLGLIRKYGVDDGAGKISIRQNSNEMVSYIKDFNELLIKEIELDIQKINFPVDIEIPGFKIEPMSLLALDPFINI